MASDVPSERSPMSQVRRTLDLIRSEDRFGLLLVLILGSIAFQMSAPNDGWTYEVIVGLQTCVLLLAMWASQVSARRLRFQFVLMAVLLAVSLLAGVVGSTDLGRGVAFLASIMLVALAPTSIFAGMRRGIREGRVITIQTALGAVCLYLLIGMAFSYVYGAIASFSDSPFFAQPQVGDGLPSDRMYFSFVTLTTTGFGDLTAGTGLGRTLAVLEALTGQLYLVIIIALIVGRIGRSPRPEDAR